MLQCVFEQLRNAMARATVHGLSISWLLLPYGGLVARSCLYLNECILLTSGTDGGGTADEPDQLSHHVLEARPPRSCFSVRIVSPSCISLAGQQRVGIWRLAPFGVCLHEPRRTSWCFCP